jgi:serine/threonine protein kinase
VSSLLVLRRFVREPDRLIRTHSKLIHPNIVLLMGIYVDSFGDRFIITEYMERGSVYDLLHPQHKPPRPPPPNITLSPFRIPTGDPSANTPDYYADNDPSRVFTYYLPERERERERERVRE